jgi:hypothetical protein
MGIDRRCEALRDQLRSISAVRLLDVPVPVVRHGDVRRRATRLACADFEGFDHGDADALPGQQIGRRQSAEPGADDTDFGVDVCGERLIHRHFDARAPVRARLQHFVAHGNQPW